MKKTICIIIFFLAITIPCFAETLNKGKNSSLILLAPEYETIYDDASEIYNDDKLYKILLTGIDEYNSQNYTGAIEIFNKLVDAQPNNFLNYYNLSIAYLELGNYEKALTYINKAIELNPDFSSNYVTRGLIIKRLYNDEAKSIENYKKALLINPKNYAAYVDIGAILIEQKRYDLAIKFLSYALDLKKIEPIYLNRGIAYALAGKYNSAIKDYNSAIKLNGTSGILYYKRGLAEESLGQYKKAISDYDNAIKYNYEGPNIYLYIGHSYELLKNYSKAVENYTKAIEKDKNCYLAYYYRGMLYLKVYDYTEKGIDDLATAEKIQKGMK